MPVCSNVQKKEKKKGLVFINQCPPKVNQPLSAIRLEHSLHCTVVLHWKKNNIHYIIHNNCWAASSVEPQRSWTILSLVAEITSSSSVSLTNQLTSLLPGIIFLMRPSTFSLEVKFLVNCLRHFYFASEKNFFITKCYLLIVIGYLSF